MRRRTPIIFVIAVAVGYVVAMLHMAKSIRTQPTEWRKHIEDIERDVHQMER